MRAARLLFVFSVLFLTAATCVPPALGQSAPLTPDLEEGMKPYGSFHGGDIDQVSLSSGKLVLNIPLVSYPQRGGKIKLGFAIRWQNITPRLTEVCYINPPCVEKAFRDSSIYVTGQLDFMDNLGWTAAVAAPIGNLNVANIFAPDNSFHQSLYVNPTYKAIDATGLAFNSSSSTLLASDGLQYQYNGGALIDVEDPNGNFVTSTRNSSGQITSWTDTLGRSIPTPLSATSTADYTHCTGANPITSATAWTVPGPNGGTETFLFCYANYSYYWTYDTGEGTAVFQGTLSMLQSVVLPNLTTWTFQYDPVYAALSQITLPTGGTISYTWSLQTAVCRLGSLELPG